MPRVALVLLLAGPAIAGPPTLDPSARRDQFMGSWTPVVAEDVGLVIGLVREVRLPGTTVPTALVALDADSLEERWRVGGLGDLMIQPVHLGTHVVRRGDTLVVADSTRRVRGIALSDGAVRWEVPLTDIPSGLCLVGDHIRVEVLDQQHVGVDRRGTPVAAPAPPCADRPTDLQGDPTGAVHWTDPPSSVRLTGLHADSLVQGNGASLLVLSKRPGTPVPHLAGLAGEGIAWSRSLTPDAFEARPVAPSAIAFAGADAVVAYHRANGKVWVQALDRADGTVRWDVPLPHGDHAAETLRVTGDRVYVGHWTWLEALDAKTGEPVATFGIW